MTNRRYLIGAAVIIGVGLALLLIYSLDRTSWAFKIFETGQTYREFFGNSAALVLELAIVSLVVAGGVAFLLQAERRRQELLWWSRVTLAGALAMQATVNIVAGFVRGSMALRAELYQTGFVSGDNWTFWASYAIEVVLLLVVNAVLPLGIFALSKIEAVLLAEIFEAPVPVEEAKRVWAWPKLRWPAWRPRSEDVPVSEWPEVVKPWHRTDQGHAHQDFSVANVKSLPTPALMWTLERLLTHLERTPDQARELLREYGITTAQRAYMVLKGLLPDDLGLGEFRQLYEELMADQEEPPAPPPSQLTPLTKAAVQHNVDLTVELLSEPEPVPAPASVAIKRIANRIIAGEPVTIGEPALYRAYRVIIDLIRADSTVSAGTLASALNVHENTAASYRKKLVELNVLRKSGRGFEVVGDVVEGASNVA